MVQTILITGSSTGLGRACAKVFQAKGWNVVATMRDPTHETELSVLPNTLVTRLDVQDLDSIKSAVAAGIDKFGRIDAVVNNAGYGAMGPIEVRPFESIRRQFDVNVLGLLAVIQALVPHFRLNKSGTIVNISSTGGRIGFPLSTLYNGTKFAVEGISESLQYELALIGVRVKLIEPGGIKTDFVSRSIDDVNDPTIVEYQPLVESLRAIMGPALEQGAEPESVAEVVYTSVTDGTDQLRYEATPDAVQFLAQRRSTDDATLFARMRTMFGL